MIKEVKSVMNSGFRFGNLALKRDFAREWGFSLELDICNVTTTYMLTILVSHTTYTVITSTNETILQVYVKNCVL